MKMFRNILHILFFSWICSWSIAQGLPFTNYSVKDGFPSSEVYHSIQDSKGFMWFSTDRGVVRYDGFKFEVFTTKDGLPDNVIFKMFEDHLGRIWFGSFSLKLSYYFEGKIHLYKYNDRIPKYDAITYLIDLYVDSSFTVYLSTYGLGYCTIDKHGKIYSKSMSKKIERKKYNHRQITFTNPHYVLQINQRKILNYAVLDAIESREKVTVHIVPLDSTFELLSKFTSYKTSYPFVNYSWVNKKYFINYRNVLFNIDSTTKKVTQIDSVPKSYIMNFPEDDGVWGSITSFGVKFYPFDGSSVRQYLSGHTVSSITIDKEGGYWFTTLDNGVFYTQSRDNLIYDNNSGLLDNYITTLAGHNNEIALGTKNGMIQMVLDSAIIDIAKGVNRTEVHKLYFDESDGYYYSIGSFFDMFNKHEIVASTAAYGSSLKGSYIFNKNHVLACEHVIFVFPDVRRDYGRNFREKIFLKQNILSENGNCRCLATRNLDSILVGRLDGLYLLSKTENIYHETFLGPYHHSLNYTITDIEVYKDGYIIATKGSGITYISTDKIYNLTTDDGLVSNQISKLYVDKYHNIWVATNEGLNIINSEGRIRKLDTKSGLVSDEITCFYRSENFIWIGTKRGLHKYPLSLFERKSSPNKVIVRSIEDSNGDYFQPGDPVILDYKNNSLKIEVSNFNYRLSGTLKLRYRIKALGEKWIEVDGSVIQLNYLPVGDNIVEIESQDELGEWSQSPTLISLSIIPPFWQTSWFLLIVILGSVTIITTIFYMRMRIKRNQENLISEINEYQQQALASQMNPHFIFNSLNSIQSFIAQNEKKLSNHYLSRFAKLMRITLNNSRSEMITIEEELYSLTLYLELESVRYKHFVYTFKIDPKINTNTTLIPPLLIQPLVENAIWHGLMHKEGTGHLSVSITKESRKIKICVKDNGVGREYSTTKITKKEYQSLSTSITNKRLELIGHQSHEKFELLVTDLYDQNNNAAGTQVCFYVPYKTIQNEDDKDIDS